VPAVDLFRFAFAPTRLTLELAVPRVAAPLFVPWFRS
jgi:hypothetical protein